MKYRRNIPPPDFLNLNLTISVFCALECPPWIGCSGCRRSARTSRRSMPIISGPARGLLGRNAGQRGHLPAKPLSSQQLTALSKIASPAGGLMPPSGLPAAVLRSHDELYSTIAHDLRLPLHRAYLSVTLPRQQRWNMAQRESTDGPERPAARDDPSSTRSDFRREARVMPLAPIRISGRPKMTAPAQVATL